MKEPELGKLKKLLEKKEYYIIERNKNEQLFDEVISICNLSPFFDFCRINYIALKRFLSEEILTSKYPDLFYNIRYILSQAVCLRATPWLGNSVLYELQDDPSDSDFSIIVREKPNFDELDRIYYGGRASKFRLKNNELVTTHPMPITISSARIRSEESRLVISIPKEELAKQSGMRMTTDPSNNDLELAGDYKDYILTPSDEGLISKLFEETIKINASAYPKETKKVKLPMELALKYLQWKIIPPFDNKLKNQSTIKEKKVMRLTRQS